ncbi:hypothetical protein JXQ70_07925 [bacterium]|nr:hypothetical protein [bacterium]
MSDRDSIIHVFGVMMALLLLCWLWSGCDWSNEELGERATTSALLMSEDSVNTTVEALPAPETFLKTFGDDCYHESATRVRQTPDGGYIICGNRFFEDGHDDVFSQLLLLRVDRYGQLVWKREWSSDSAKLRVEEMVLIEDTQEIVMCGNQSKYKVNAFILKTDADGVEIYFNVYPFRHDSIIYSMVGTEDGGYVLAGHDNGYPTKIFFFKINANGEKLWERKMSKGDDALLSAVTTSHEGGLIFTGTQIESGYERNILVMKTDAEGNEQWSRLYGNPCHDDSSYRYFDGRRIQRTDDGGFIIGAEKYENGSIIYLLKIDSDGNQEWVQEIRGRQSSAWFGDIIQTSDGGYVIAGKELESSYISTRQIACYYKRDALGRMQWSLSLDEFYTSSLGSVQELENNKGFIFGGACQKHDTYYAYMDYDIVLLKTDSQGYY